MTLEVDAAPTLTDSPPTQEGGLGVFIGQPSVDTKDPLPDTPLDDLDEIEVPEGEAQESESEESAEVEPSDLPDGWEEKESVKALIESARRDAQAKSDRAKEREVEMAVIDTRQEVADALSAVHIAELEEAQRIGSVASVVNHLKQRIDDAFEDPDMATALRGILSQNPEWAQAYTGAQRSVAQESIANRLLNSPEFASGLDADSARRVTGEVQKVDIELRGKRITHEEAMVRILAARDRVRDAIIGRSAVAAQNGRLEQLARKKVAAEDANSDRQSRRAPVPAGGGIPSASRDAERVALLDPSTPVSKLVEIRNRHKAAGG